ncbi:MAG: NAD(P)/FAD-dependent oxidoreductase [Thermoanaerobaculia bacterium]
MTEPIACDVLVAGAGPAGSTLAALLAARGADVVLADRDVFPRDKVCGEFLSWDAMPVLERIGATALVRRASPPPITRCRILGRKTTIDVALPGSALGISRFRLDAILAATARDRGARLLQGATALSIERNGGRFVTRLSIHEGEEVAVDARAVAGAWGRWGRLDIQLDRPFVAHKRNRYIGFKRHYEGPHALPSSVDLYPFPGGYLGAQAVEEGRVNICGLVHQERLATLRGGWPAFVETLRRWSARLDALFAATPLQEDFLASEPLIFRAKEPVHDGIVLVGDAAGLIDPLTGNGMAMAVQSAALAAEPILSLLAGDDGALARYARAHHAHFAPRLRWSRAAAALLRHPKIVDAGARIPGAAPLAELFARCTRSK